MKESVDSLSWPEKKIHIVHSDDPRNESYIKCDILIRGELFDSESGNFPFEMYNNRMLEIIPDSELSWVAFIDDDDYYLSTDIFEKNILGSPKDTLMFIAKARPMYELEDYNNISVEKKEKIINYGVNTESVIIRSDLAKRFRWGGNSGGDREYNSKSLRFAHDAGRLVWKNIVIAMQQESSGYGKRLDKNEKIWNQNNYFAPDDIVFFRIKRGGIIPLRFKRAIELEEKNIGRITYKGVEVIYKNNEI